jgi:hypothetical protein
MSAQGIAQVLYQLLDPLTGNTEWMWWN